MTRIYALLLAAAAAFMIIAPIGCERSPGEKVADTVEEGVEEVKDAAEEVDD